MVNFVKKAILEYNISRGYQSPMKIQNLIFFLIFLFVFWQRQPRLSVIIGLCCLLLAMPLFKFWIFFTAERLTWYTAAFFLYAIVLFLVQGKNKNERN